MARNANAIFTAARGYIYIADVGSAEAPTVSDISSFDPSVGLASGWEEVGHTSREEMPEFGFDGGEVETRGTWQADALREVVTEALVDYVIIYLHQFDEAGLALYYGQESSGSEPGEFVVMNSPTSGIEKQLCMVMVDGDEFAMGFYSPKSSIRREDAITLAIDEFAALPLRATFLKEDGQELYRWIGGGIGTGDGGS